MVYYIISFLLIVALGFWVVKLMREKRESEKEVVLVEREKDDYVVLGRGLAEYNLKLQEKKQEAKNKILEMLNGKRKVSNQDVVKMLGISSMSVVRYLDELEKEGKVKQIGKTGKKVFYQAIN